MKKVKVRLWVKIVIFIIIFTSIVFVYGVYIEPNTYKINEYNVIDSKLPNNFYGFKVAHISDIKYNSTIDKAKLKEIVEEINLLKPDIVIISGDLFSKNVKYKDKDYKELKEILKSIDYNIGKYAIKGDSDLKIKKWEEVITDSDFIDLNDSYELIYDSGIDPMLIVGISSNYKKNHIKDSLTKINNDIKEGYKYSILVMHEPDFIKDIDYSKYNLILAGHTLNGQVRLPFIGGIINNKYSKIYNEDYYKLNSTNLYISNGLGVEKYKFRMFNTPSVNFYRLRNK